MLSKHCNSLYMLLPEDIVITRLQCQRTSLESVRCLRPFLQSLCTTTHAHTRACRCQPPMLEGEACLCAATALTRGPMPSRCKLPTVAGADRSLQGTTARSQPQCRRLSLRRDVAEGWCTRENSRTLVCGWPWRIEAFSAISRFGRSQPSFVGLATGHLRIRYCSATLFRGRCGGEKRRAVLF